VTTSGLIRFAWSVRVRISGLVVTFYLALILVGCNRPDPGTFGAKVLQPQTVRVIEKINQGDTQAILELGRLGDRAAIPYLKELRQKPRPDRSCHAILDIRMAREEAKTELYETFPCVPDNAVMALAKLGEQDQMREIVQELESADYVVQVEATLKLAYLGGPEAIRMLVNLLDRHEGRAVSDFFYPALSQMAAYALARIVPDPPVGPEIRFADIGYEHLDLWRKWLGEHPELLK
jgi:hypothetical protein